MLDRSPLRKRFHLVQWFGRKEMHMNICTQTIFSTAQKEKVWLGDPYCTLNHAVCVGGGGGCVVCVGYSAVLPPCGVSWVCYAPGISAGDWYLTHRPIKISKMKANETDPIHFFWPFLVRDTNYPKQIQCQKQDHHCFLEWSFPRKSWHTEWVAHHSSQHQKKHQCLRPAVVPLEGEGTTAIKDKMIWHLATRVHCVAGVFSHCATWSWEDAGSVFHPVSPRILRTRVKVHMLELTPSSGTVSSGVLGPEKKYQQHQTT